MNRNMVVIPTSKRAAGRLLVSLCVLMTIVFSCHVATGQQQQLTSLTPQLVQAINQAGKKRVAVVDFTDLDGNVTKLGRYLAEELSTALVQNRNSFEVIDRTHLKIILQEHKLSATGLIDPSTARKLGQIAGADALVTATITPFGESMKVAVRILDTSTAAVVGAATADVPKTKTIGELGGEGISGEQAAATATSSPTGAVAQENEFLFAAKSCVQSGRILRCSGTITNKSDNKRAVGIDRSTTLVDDEGNQYDLRDIYLGTLSGFTPHQQLEPELAIAFSCSAENVRARIGRVSILLRYMTEDGPSSVIALRNVPVQQK